MNRWFVYSKSGPRLRLFCFPYAGGGASIFRLWPNYLPTDVEICPIYLPGREIRVQEQPLTRIDELVDQLVLALQPALGIPFAFFGHSMGALISFALARRLRQAGLREPSHLFVSAHRAPQLPRERHALYSLPEPEFIEEVQRLGGTPQEVLQHKELMELVMPILRADFELCEAYIYKADAPLICPITAFGGVKDIEVPEQVLAGWREQTRGQFTLHILPGDHFFLQDKDNQQQMLKFIVRDLTLIHCR